MKIYKDISIKEQNADFIVNEVASLPLDLVDEPTNDRYKYTVLRVLKSGFTTFEVIDVLAQKLKLPKDAINCLGLKDEDGITAQYMSTKTIISANVVKRLNLAETKDKLIDFKIQGYSKKPLKEKRLHGNVFNLQIRGLTESEAEKLSESIGLRDELTFINYYDQQRFGLPGGPYVSHKIGESLVNGNKEAALKYYIKSGNANIDGYNSKLVRTQVFDELNPKKVDFFVSAYTSYLWNKKLSQKVSGKSKGVYIEIFKNYTLPVVNEGASLSSTLKVNGYEYAGQHVIGAVSKSRQTTITTKIFAEQPEPDNLNIGKYSLWLEFFLPTGCYATMAVKQLLASRI